MKKSSSKFDSNAEKSTGLMFIKTYNKWHRSIKTELETLGVTHPQYVVLATTNYLSLHQEEVRQIDIANMSDIDVMTTSDILKVLEKKALIKRYSSPSDGRAKAVDLTEQGLAIVKKATIIVEGIDEQFFGVLGDSESVFIDLLKKLV